MSTNLLLDLFLFCDWPLQLLLLFFIFKICSPFPCLLLFVLLLLLFLFVIHFCSRLRPLCQSREMCGIRICSDGSNKAETERAWRGSESIGKSVCLVTLSCFVFLPRFIQFIAIYSFVWLYLSRFTLRMQIFVGKGRQKSFTSCSAVLLYLLCLSYFLDISCD